jgi:hypothetical protein
MSGDSELRRLINKIVREQAHYENLAFDEESHHVLGAPASDEAIRSLEARLGAPLPPDYRAFLKLHNGWQNFHADGKLLAIEDQDDEWVREKVKFWSDLWASEDPNPFARGAIPIMLGQSLHHFVVLDPTQVRPESGTEIAEYDSMRKRAVFESFSAYLRRESDVLQRLIDRELHGIPEDDEDAPVADQG